MEEKIILTSKFCLVLSRVDNFDEAKGGFGWAEDGQEIPTKAKSGIEAKKEQRKKEYDIFARRKE